MAQCSQHVEPQIDCVDCHVGEYITTMAEQGRIELAPSSLCEIYKNEINVVLETFGYEALVTDSSTVCDFGITENEMLIFSERFGISITHTDTIVDVAKRLREKDKA